MCVVRHLRSVPIVKAHSFSSGILRARTGYPAFVILIGLLLIAVGAGFTVDVFLQNSQHVDVDVLGRTFSVSPGWIVIGGIVALAIFVVGVRCFSTGIRAARRRRSAVRSAESAQRERDLLAQQLAAERERKIEDAKPVEESQHPAEAMPSSLD